MVRLENLTFEPLDDRERSAEELAELSEARDRILEVVGTLTRSKQEVVRLRFGFNESGLMYSRDEMSRILKVSQQRVSGIEAIALAMLPSPMRKSRLEPFLSGPEQ